MNNSKIKFLNTYVNNVSMKETLSYIENCIKEDSKKSYIIAVNVDVIIKIENDSYLKEIADNADMVLMDGKPLVWISSLLKTPVKEKISGSDLVPLVCEMAANKGYTMFFIGGKEGIADQAKVRLEKQYPQIKIVGTYAPKFGFEKSEEELNKINRMISDVKPDILVVCFGCPKQEKFIYENIDKYDAKISICAGATIDFLAGNISRAPQWMSNNGLEWFYRFMQEPKRLFRRYFVDDTKIFKLIWKYR
ncbi:acetyl-mannosamine transferase [Clostridium beijerinckii]|uniref:WecB/TagA/CpsF family glycosyltransferase n=1 Tax=Clostridium beijerinckii TaxID=1520 RepID=A0AB74VJ58_CLOBE|nr:WecB/TagA/CpsF family glycosyltransferase [Clostridium beijerinckii]NRZ25592.1 N-acetylglucosaminyldiphosphoundecaprenol N-acetyl-beta-D-mannosaminyltransferase [Clostridium beijerinckii]NYB98107.1 N-acetylglucosaminyldiphosphoundecaprenol N-acetyl-beta-D-mannosaminyltransferase [Clostridium beijerinckii]OOM23277.1 putative N-acetylmannosaminyltransferase [Clostridium beijerinckii]QUN36347.1 WecB/TagA/CpsF family glycosyltransferase [Clostridium beijerinckii]SQB12945.1 teichoic acid biosynt